VSLGFPWSHDASSSKANLAMCVTLSQVVDEVKCINDGQVVKKSLDVPSILKQSYIASAFCYILYNTP
jgi:hypothetical protein